MSDQQAHIDEITPFFEVKAVNFVRGAIGSGVGEPWRRHRIVIVRGEADFFVSEQGIRLVRVVQCGEPTELEDARIVSIEARPEFMSIVLSGV